MTTEPNDMVETEDAEILEVFADDFTELDDDKLSPEQLKTELAKVRREAASKRVSNKEIKAKLDAYEEWKLSQMSEVDRLKAERDELIAKVEADQTEKLQRKIAKELKLPAALADRIRGNTEEEMREDAKTMSTRLRQSNSGGATAAGNRGSAVGTGAATTQDEWFRDLFKNAQ